MSILTRLTPLALTVAAVGATVCLGLRLVLGADTWELPGLLGRWHSELERQQQLEQQLGSMRARVRRKVELTQALIEGKVTLREAVAEIFKVRRQVAERFPAARLPPTQSEQEDIRKDLLADVRQILEGRPAKARAVLERLEAEWQLDLAQPRQPPGGEGPARRVRPVAQ